MPRLIDPEARNAEISAAALRILARDGLAALSVRGVAEEAGIAPASLRRAFPTQHALREHCLSAIESRVAARVRAHGEQLLGRALVDAMLAELLPLDAERRLELTAQVQLGVLALTDAALQPTTERLNAGVARACEAAVAILAQEGQLAETRDQLFEAARLHALLDGLAMQALWAGEPGTSATDAPPTHAPLNMLATHLDELAH